jgi:hypothetical protein
VTETEGGSARSIWLAPVEGVFGRLREAGLSRRQADFSLDLEPGIALRSPTDSDAQLLDDWFRTFEKYITEPEIESAKAADLVIHSDTEQRNFPEKVTAFVLALSLHTRSPLTARALHFDLNGEGNVDTRQGHEVNMIRRMPNWDAEQVMERSELHGVAQTYPHVVRARESQHSMARSLGAYRAAVSAAFLDTVPILACASLEALVAADKSGVVIRRVVRRYAPEDDLAEEKLNSLYKLRHWFAHGATIPEMRESDVRDRVLDDGLATVKEILRAAYADDDLAKAADSGIKAVRACLDE